MAYINFDEPMLATVQRSAVQPRHDPVETPAPARLGALEWSVIALARRDRFSSLRRPGRLAVALRSLFGGGSDLPLADARLEALRRMAVWSWHHGYAVPTSELRAFLAAGFSLDQYDAMLASIGATRGAEATRH